MTGRTAMNEPFLTFSLGTQRYALAIEEVVEVATMVELVQVAGMPPEVIGVANRH
ncbi:MAG: chemotaxis protein CheW, partial [Anaerolineae bacterium]|nr:chemotaxis protein CheW [Anaerolineae bacterium]